MQRTEALRRVLFFKTLPQSAIDDIARSGQEIRLNKGEQLFAENERCKELIVVLSGAVKVYKVDDRGRELTLGLEEPGSSVAELPLFDGGNYPASAEAAENDTRVFLVPKPIFAELLGRYPQITTEALRAFAIRMRRLVRMVEVQALHTVQARIGSYLVRVAGGRSEFLLEETNEAIAGQVGTVREVVSRTLRSLKEAGAISLHGRHVTVRDPDLLRRIAGGKDDSLS
ncbi:MAG TPA: Crp/Fnr family transcriptional regulator [Capsulimonadaceae bacterium]|nr:Crp/Fnr family transcriptional regulator [Capsulimonadaceae bacterium]